MAKVKCPECGHTFYPRRSRLISPKLAKLAVTMIGNATVPFLAAYALSTGIGELYAGGWAQSTRLALSSIAAGSGLLLGASQDTIGRIAGLRPSIRIHNRTLRTADVFTSAVQSIAPALQRNKAGPVGIAPRRAAIAKRVQVATVPVAIAITDNLTDREMFQFLRRADSVGLARAGHVPRAMTRQQYDEAVQLLYFAQCIIGRGGNKAGRLVDRPGRVMMRVYEVYVDGRQ